MPTIRKPSSSIPASLLKPQRVQCASTAATPTRIDTEAPIPTFVGVAYSGGPMYPKGYQIPLVIDLQGLAPLPQSTAVDREHNRELVTGNTRKYINTGRQILCAGVFTGSDQEVVATTRKARQAGTEFPWFLSIDADIEQGEPLYKGQTAVVNGQTISGPAIIARRSVGRTLSFVLRSGDPNAKATVQAAGGNPMTFEEWLAKLGFSDQTALTVDQKKNLQAMYDAEQLEGADSLDNPDSASIAASSGHQSTVKPGRLAEEAAAEIRKATSDEMTRCREIRRVCEAAGNPVFRVQGVEHDLATFAIEQNWSPMKAELEAVRESRPKAPSGHVTNVQCSSDALIASLIQRGGINLEQALPRRLQVESGGRLPNFLFEDINSNLKQQVLASSHGMRNLSSWDFAKAVIELSGKPVGFDYDRIIEAASSSNLSNVIQTSANVTAMMRYEMAGDTTADWCEEDLLGKTFFATPVVGMKNQGGSLPLLKTSTAEETGLDDQGESIQVCRFAEQMSVDDRTFENDQLGEVVKAFGTWGAKAANNKPDLVYSLLLANANMSDGVAVFHATHRNLLASSALSSDTLAAAVTKMRLQYESDAKGLKALLNLQPTHIVLPPTLELLAKTLVRTQETRSETGQNVPTLSPFNDLGLSWRSDARLELGLVHPLTGVNLSGSSTTWFLVNAKSPPILVRYLKSNGKSPMVRSTPLTQGRWGMHIDIKLDIGAAVIREKSAVKATA